MIGEAIQSDTLQALASLTAIGKYAEAVGPPGFTVEL